MNASINGLMEGISVIENDNKRYEYYQTVAITDMLYNNQRPEEIYSDLQGLYWDEGFTVSEYDPSAFNETVNLMSISNDDTFSVNLNDIIHD